MKLSLFFLLSHLAQASEEPPKFEARKKEALARLDGRISSLQKLRECMNKAADKDALRSCQKAMRENEAPFRKKRGENHR